MAFRFAVGKIFVHDLYQRLTLLWVKAILSDVLTHLVLLKNGNGNGNLSVVFDAISQ